MIRPPPRSTLFPCTTLFQSSSQNTSAGQTANKANNGVIDGYPGDYTQEWATSGGRPGSWLDLTWSRLHPVDSAAPYARAYLREQITSGPPAGRPARQPSEVT